METGNESNERPPREERLSWWREAKLGMFIHWGIYSLYGGVYKGHHQARGGAEWIENRCKIPVAEYRDKAKQFNPVNYDPDAWVRLAKEAGLRYLIITTKHHDGFALFDTQASDWNAVESAPCARDLIRPLVDACRKYGMRLGFYYSQANDWTNPGGTAARRLMSEGWPNPDGEAIDRYTLEHRGHWDPVQDSATFDEYIDGVAVPQIRELLTNYGPVDILWWDYATEMISYEGAEKIEAALMLQPGIITNDRLHPDFHGDTRTPEQTIPAWDSIGDDGAWETCMTMNGSWGYKSWDRNWKSVAELIVNLVRVVARGGNYLLNIGPRGDGSIPAESTERLKAVGQWLKINGEAIYGTLASPLREVSWGEYTSREEDDGSILYCHVMEWPQDGRLRIDGLSNRVKQAALLDGGTGLPVEQSGDAVTVLLPANTTDPAVSVVRLDVEGTIERRQPSGTEKAMQTGALG